MRLLISINFFFHRCGKTENNLGDASLHNTCGDIDYRSCFGVIMQSTCRLLESPKNKKDCQTVRQLDMILEQEIPVFDWNTNLTYRSVACARCNSGGNLSFWGLKITCSDNLQPPRDDITALKTFVTENAMCSWKYEPFPNLKQHYKFCIVPDLICTNNQLSVMSAVKELCSSYSMVFSVDNGFNYIHYRNPHCALCNPEGRREDKPTSPGIASVLPPLPPLTILLDVSSNILNQEVPKTPQPPTQHHNLTTLSYNLTSQMLNCSSFIKNCTVIFGGKACVFLTSLMNQTTQMFLNTSRVKVLTPKQLLLDKSAIKPTENTVVLLCPDNQTVKHEQHGFSVVFSYITFIGTVLSVISLCFLLGVYLSFKELRNLPGKCLISLSWSLLCYQVIFFFIEKSKEVEAACKAIAIGLHFFVLAAFTWMSVIAFDTANTFQAQGKLNHHVKASHNNC